MWRVRLLPLFIIALGLSIFASSFIGVPKASAASPLCFARSLTGDAPFHTLNCNDSSVKSIIDAFGGLKDDTCYVISGGAYLPSVETATIDSETCKKWQADAGALTGVAPKCIQVDGSIQDWQDGKIDSLSEIHEIPCDQALVDKLVASGVTASLSSFADGTCYIVYKDSAGKYIHMQRECWQGLSELISHMQINNASGFPTNVDRDAVAECDGQGSAAKLQKCLDDNPIIKLVNWAISIIGGLAGVVIVAVIVVGGIQYATSGANPQAVGAAKGKIINAITALLMLIFMYSFLQWLVPGGIF